LATVAPSRTERRGGTGYRPHLDGLRAVAVYLVVLFHAGADRFSGGFIGVDVFFVLSGYLVTQLLLRDLVGRGSIRLGRFYARRMRRLLPAAVAALLITGLVYAAISPKIQVDQSVDAFKASFLYVANWFFIHRSTGYFTTDVNTLPVVHFWSLAVEEQFYVLWPLLLGGLFVATRRLARNSWRAMQVVVAVAGVGSAIAALIIARHNLDRAYYGTDTRAYELLAGAFLALTPGLVERVRRTRLGPPVGAIAGVALLLLATSLFDVNAVERGVATTLVTLVLLVCIEGSTEGVTNRVLSSRPAVYLGKISYGTYLWHWPALVVVFAATDHRISSLSAFGIAALAGTGIASLSYQILEMPIREHRPLDRISPAVIATGLVIGIVCALVVVPSILDSGGHALEAGSAPSSVVLTPVPSNLPFDTAKSDLGGQLRGVHFLPEWNCDNQPVSACTIVHGSGEKVLVIGDSHAWMLFPAFAKIAQEDGFQFETDASAGCPWQRRVFDAEPVHRHLLKPCLSAKRDLYDRVLPALKPDLVIIANADYSYGGRGAIYDSHDKPIKVAQRDMVQAVKTESERSLREIEKYTKKVLIVDPFPIADDDPFVCLTRSEFLESCRFTVSKVSQPLMKVYAGLADQTRTYVVDWNKLACPNLPICDPVVNGLIVRWDIEHLTPRYALSIAPQIRAYLERTKLVARGSPSS
jgi:peptidoglycan/LPS O-acetylase OafA/YrhL